MKPAENRVGDAAEVAREHADRDPDRHRGHAGGHPDQQRDPGAVDDPHEQVAAQVVGADQERRGGRLGRPCAVRPVFRYWVSGPWPTRCAISGAAIAAAKSATMKSEHASAIRSRRIRSKASARGERA